MTQTIPLGSDARERFVLEIAQVLPPERIVEAHFFAPLRQGQIETGVCVLGALPEGAEPLPSVAVSEVLVPDAPPSEVLDNGVSLEPEAPAVADAAEATAATEDATVADVAAPEDLADHPLSEIAEQPVVSTEPAVGDPATDDPATDEAASVAQQDSYPAGARISSRHVVYSARYRWTRKGPERGKWECEVVAEADAPLLTVEAVVQGVRQRASEPLEVQKLDGDTVREMIAKAQQQWQKTA